MKKHLYFLFAFALWAVTGPGISAQNYSVRYFSENNLNVEGLRLLRNFDGGYVLLTATSCYTPGSIVIEGCPIALRPLKTNATGDSLWITELPHPQIYGGIRQIMEQGDLTLSIFFSELSPGNCLGFGVGGGGGGGLKKARAYRVEPPGTPLAEKTYYLDCEQFLEDVLRKGSDEKIMLSNYDQSILSSLPERRAQFYMLDYKNDVQSVKTYNDVNFEAAQLAWKTPTQFYMACRNKTNSSSQFQLSLLDLSANFIWTKTYDNVVNPGYTRELLLLPDAGVIHLGGLSDANGDPILRLSRFDANGEFLWFKDLPGSIYDSDLTVRFDGKYLLAQAVTSSNSSILSVRLLDTDGDSLHLASYDLGPAGVEVGDIISTGGESFVVGGTARCCGLDAAVGPAQAFMLFGEFGSVASEEPKTPATSVQVSPNPAAAEVFFQVRSTVQGPYVLKLYDAVGREIRQQRFSETDFSIRRENLPAGLYGYGIFTEQGLVARGKILFQP